MKLAGKRQGRMDYEIGKNRPPKHAQFRKGQSGNPDGARKHDPVKKAIKRLTSKELSEVISTALLGTVR